MTIKRSCVWATSKDELNERLNELLHDIDALADFDAKFRGDVIYVDKWEDEQLIDAMHYHEYEVRWAVIRLRSIEGNGTELSIEIDQNPEDPYGVKDRRATIEQLCVSWEELVDGLKALGLQMVIDDEDRSETTMELSPQEEGQTQGQLVQAEQATAPRRSVFRKRGQVWEIRYDGGDISFLPDRKGFGYIAFLLKYRHKRIGVVEIEAAVEGTVPDHAVTLNGTDDSIAATDGGDDQVKVDPETIHDVEAALETIEEKLTEAQVAGNEQLENQLDEQKKEFERYLREAIGKDGESRRFSDRPNKTRQRITQNISNALGEIQEVEPDLYHHLSSTIKTGYKCSYRPDPNTSVNWEL